MKRIQKFAALSVIAALVGTGIPAIAAQNGHDIYNRGMQYRSDDHRGNREWNDNRNRGYGNEDRGDRGRRDYDARDRGRDYGYGYAPAPVYQSTPVYGGPVYDNGYYYDRTHNGRAAAMIGGSAAAGALIGAAAGHGEGAVIGAVIGGIAGAAVNAAADHQHRY
jgi:hypothetical protein